MVSQPRISYLVVGTPRSGSSLLCEKLRDTGVAGCPEETFSNHKMHQWGKRWETNSIEEYVVAAMRELSTSNGVFGAKLLWPHWHREFLPKLRALPQLADLSEAELLNDHFPNLHYVLITRRDRLRQAVSWEKAFQTWVWASDPTRPAPVSRAQPVFDYVSIKSRVEQLQNQEEDWQRIVRDSGNAVYHVVYEELITAPENTALDILDFLGIDVPHDMHFTSRLQRQADEVNEEWEELYLAIQRGTRITYELVSPDQIESLQQPSPSEPPSPADVPGDSVKTHGIRSLFRRRSKGS